MTACVLEGPDVSGLSREDPDRAGVGRAHPGAANATATGWSSGQIERGSRRRGDEALVRLGDASPVPTRLKAGRQDVEVVARPSNARPPCRLVIEAADRSSQTGW